MMAKNNELHKGTGFSSPVSSYYFTQSSPSYRRLGAACVLVGISGSGGGSDNSVETGTNGASFDKSGKIEQKNLFAEAAIAACPRCGSDQVVPAAGVGPHYASVRCANCDRFIKWTAKPKLGGQG